MGKLLFFYLLIPFFVFNQDVIWQENFESYSDGVQNTSKWTTQARNCDTDGVPGTSGNNFWGVRTTSGNKEFCCEDIEGLTCCLNSQGQSDNLWLSEDIDITDYPSISISISMRVEGNMECSTCGQGNDLFKAEYQIDGGGWNNFLSVCGLQNGSSLIECVDVSGGNTLKIRVLLGNQADDEEYYFDDVMVIESQCAIVLPVELVSFDGFYSEENYENVLNWITASEINNDRFEIYSKTNQDDWEYIGYLKGAGNSNQINNYNFNHRSESTLTYYQIKQVDYDGVYKKSNIISILKNEDEVIDFVIYDMMGKELDIEPSEGVYFKKLLFKNKTIYQKIFK